MEPSPVPSSNRFYTVLGFLSILLIFWGIFHLIFQGALRTEHLTYLDFLDPRSPLFYGQLGLVTIGVRVALKELWNRSPQFRKKSAAVVNSHKTIGLMTGVGYFFLFVIGLFVVIPVIALVYMKLTGKL
jgi:hypothetical protein